MKSILVTGGAGLIGSRLLRLLLEDSRVTCIDNISSGQLSNIEGLKDNENFRFIKGDIKDPLEIDGKVDYVYHLASRASPVDFVKYPIDILLTNSLGTFNTLSLAKENNAKYFFASTSEIYGDPEEHPQKESYWGNVNPLGPRSCYDESKRFGEAMVMAFVREHGLDARIGRIFNTYGPGMRANDGRVISNFIVQCIEHRPITIYGNGTQTRSFCYVDDLVEGIRKVMMKGKKGTAYNLGNPKEITIKELAGIIKRLASSDSEMVYKPQPEDEPKRRQPDISLARAEIGWEPTAELETGLKITIDWFRKALLKK